MNGMTIANIAGGSLVERANEKIQEVLANIMDVNTPADKKRSVVITLTFVSDDDNRDISYVDFDVKSKLVAARKISTIVACGIDSDGQVIAEELQKGGIKGQMYVDSDTGEIVEPQIKGTVNKLVSIK